MRLCVGCSGGSRGEAREPTPLIFRPNWGPPIFFLRLGPPLTSGSGWPTPPPPPLSEILDLPLGWYYINIMLYKIINFMSSIMNDCQHADFHENKVRCEKYLHMWIAWSFEVSQETQVHWYLKRYCIQKIAVFALSKPYANSIVELK